MHLPMEDAMGMPRSKAGHSNAAFLCKKRETRSAVTAVEGLEKHF